MDRGAWDEIHAAVRAAPYPVDLVPVDPDCASSCLARLGITTRSWLGGVVAHTGGVLVDHGWLRVLGSGGNGLAEVGSDVDRTSGLLVVGYDILGGQFAWAPSDLGRLRPSTTSRRTPSTGWTQNRAMPHGSMQSWRVP